MLIYILLFIPLIPLILYARRINALTRESKKATSEFKKMLSEVEKRAAIMRAELEDYYKRHPERRQFSRAFQENIS